MKTIKFRTLSADEIEVRVGEKKNGYMTLLLYQDARCAMNILDETLGQFGWACQYKEEKGTLFAGIAIKDGDGTWVWKWDAGSPSNFEAQKGESSDAFKRAAVRWGLARELYSAPRISIPESNSRHSVLEIGYDENRKITDLEIADGKGDVVFSMHDGKVRKAEQKTNKEKLYDFCVRIQKEGEPEGEIKKFYAYYKDKVGEWNSFNPQKQWDKWCDRK